MAAVSWTRSSSLSFQVVSLLGMGNVLVEDLLIGVAGDHGIALPGDISAAKSFRHVVSLLGYRVRTSVLASSCALDVDGSLRLFAVQVGSLALRPPMADCGGDLTGGVLPQIVAGLFQDDGVVIGKDGLEAAPLVLAEHGVFRPPDDQRRTVCHLVQPLLDLLQQRAGIEDLAGEDVDRFA